MSGFQSLTGEPYFFSKYNMYINTVADSRICDVHAKQESFLLGGRLSRDVSKFDPVGTEQHALEDWQVAKE